MAEFHLGPGEIGETVSIGLENLYEAKRSAILIGSLLGFLTWVILIVPVSVMVWRAAF